MDTLPFSHRQTASELSAESEKSGRRAANDAQPAEYMQWLSYMVRRADRHINRQFIATFGHDQGLPPVALSMLITISMSPGLDQHDIAILLDMDKANAARLIRHLHKAGWLTRRREDTDHRKLGVFLTPQGVHELNILKRRMRQFEQTISSDLTPDEIRTLLSLLERVGIPDSQ